MDISKVREIFDAIIKNKCPNEEFEELYNLSIEMTEYIDEYAVALICAAIYSSKTNKEEQIELDKNVYWQLYEKYIKSKYTDKENPETDANGIQIDKKTVIIYDIPE